MHRNIRSAIAKTVAVTLALSLAAISAPDSEAAKKPKLSVKSVTVSVNKTKKVKIKNVKAKQVKKLTVKVNKKSIASVKKNGKTAFTVKGKKAGKAKVTAKVKVGKKTTTLKVNVTVKRAASPTITDTPATGTPNTPVQTSPVTTEPAATDAVPTQSSENQGPSEPVITPLVNYSENFDEGLGDWIARYDPEQGNEAKLTLSDEAHSGKAALISGRDGHTWNGPAIDLTKCITPGASYKVTFWAKVPQADDDFEDGINLRVSGAYKTEEDGEEKYENYPADTDYPIAYTEWTKVEVEFAVPSALYSYIFYLETNGSGRATFLIDDFTMERTSAPAEFDPALTSIKTAYSPYIDTVGTAVSYDQLLNTNILGFVKHHYNSITMGNAMKPDALLGSKNVMSVSEEAASSYSVNDAYGTYDGNKDADGNVIVPVIDFTETDKILKLAKENGLKLRYHTLIWHQQMPKHFFTEQYDEEKEYVDKDTMLAREEMYIRTVMNHVLNSEYSDVLYAVDVVNEYTHMSNESAAVGSENFWKYAFGTEMKTDCEYVKKAFVWAYDELVKANRTGDVSLIYNDYNTYDPSITAAIIELINNINTVDDVNTVGKICAGVGMQAHFNDSTATVEAFDTALTKFAEQDFEIQITELDVTNTGTVTGETSAADKAEVWAANAEMYSGIMNTILTQKTNGANISSVTIWGISDATSWREDRAPVLFGTDVADKKPSFDAVINAALNFGQ
ncbi:MAG: endo-1,4-beta-xylanase [Roseburia sp.]|nr:endo-1,4-beta-xylanase [Roseburia sp.]